MAKTKQQIGRASRNKGKRFERACRDVMWDITGWQYWKRTQRGDKQWAGDLVVCMEDGSSGPFTEPFVATSYYVECRARGTLTSGMMNEWFMDVRTMAQKGKFERSVLLCKQDRGPILAICSWEQKLGIALVARIY